MKIETLKDLEAVLKLCNKQGVAQITIDGIAIKLDGLPESKKLDNTDSKPAPEMSEEDLLYWSSTPAAQ